MGLLISSRRQTSLGYQHLWRRIGKASNTQDHPVHLDQRRCIATTCFTNPINTPLLFIPLWLSLIVKNVVYIGGLGVSIHILQTKILTQKLD